MIPADCLKSYRDALAQYHLHPEAKFQGGDYADSGVTSRRHIVATAIEHIGKEANRWQEQFHLGLDMDAQTEYGIAPEDCERVLAAVVRAGEKFGQRKLAEVAGVSLREVSAVVSGKRQPAVSTLAKLYRAVPQLETISCEQTKYMRKVLNAVKHRCQQIGSVGQFADRAGVDRANLAHVLSGRRNPSEAMLARLEMALAHR